MKILGVDTALGACSAAVLEDGCVLARRHVAMERGHAEALAPMVAEVMSEAGLAFAALDRLAVTVGPGTFTGQRVGLAFMRALRIALKKPLLGVTSLGAMGAEALAETGALSAAVVHDARRGEVYLELVGDFADPPVLTTFEDAAARIKAQPSALALAGTATASMAKVVESPNLRLTAITAPDAVWVARLGALLVPPQAPPRPLYLRAPDAKLPAGRT